MHFRSWGRNPQARAEKLLQLHQMVDEWNQKEEQLRFCLVLFELVLFDKEGRGEEVERIVRYGLPPIHSFSSYPRRSVNEIAQDDRIWMIEAKLINLYSLEADKWIKDGLYHRISERYRGLTRLFDWIDRTLKDNPKLKDHLIQFKLFYKDGYVEWTETQIGKPSVN